MWKALKRRKIKWKTVLLMAGMPGTGKSSLARKLAKQLGRSWVVLDKDVFHSAMLNTEIEGKTASKAAYTGMFAVAQDLLEQGFSVIIDSPALYGDTIKQAMDLAAQANARFVVLRCTAEDRVRNRRLIERPKHRSQQETKPESITQEEEVRRFEHLPATTLVLDTTNRPPEELVEITLQFLARQTGLHTNAAFLIGTDKTLN
jgi:predicted kinase